MPSCISKDFFSKCNPIVRCGNVDSTYVSVRHNLADGSLQILLEGSVFIDGCVTHSECVTDKNS